MPFQHGFGLAGIAPYNERPWENWDKSCEWAAANSVGVALNAKGYPTKTPTDGQTLAMFVTQSTNNILPMGDYIVETDARLTATPTTKATLQMLGVNSATLIGASSHADGHGRLWRLTIGEQGTNIGLFFDFGGVASGTNITMTRFRMRTDPGGGTIPASVYNDTPIWRSAFLTLAGKVPVLRFMDWMMTNDNFSGLNADWVAGEAANVAIISQPTTYSARAQLDSFNWCDQKQRGTPVEVMVSLCNTLYTTYGELESAWFNFHYYATSSYIQSFVEYVRDNLNTALVARFELSNEVWNNGFPQRNAAWREGISLYGDAGGDVGIQQQNLFKAHSNRVKTMGTTVNTAYSGITSRRKNVYAFQNGVVSYADLAMDWNDARSVIQEYSTAPYFEAADRTNAYYASLGDGVGGSASWTTALANAIRTKRDGETLVNLDSSLALATTDGKGFFCYEGGQHLLNIDSPLNWHTHLYNFNNSATMGTLQAEMISALKTRSCPICWFTMTGAWGTSGYWGLNQSFSDSNTPKMQAVLDDISGGSGVTYTFTFVATDGAGNTSSQIVTITVA